jgi:HEAT repeat protein
VRDTDRDVKLTALWTLGEIEDGAGMDVVALALQDRDTDARQMAAWALGQIEDSTAVRNLTPPLKDPHIDVRVVAAWPRPDRERVGTARTGGSQGRSLAGGAAGRAVGNRQIDDDRR